MTNSAFDNKPGTLTLIEPPAEATLDDQEDAMNQIAEPEPDLNIGMSEAEAAEQGFEEKTEEEKVEPEKEIETKIEPVEPVKKVETKIETIEPEKKVEKKVEAIEPEKKIETVEPEKKVETKIEKKVETKIGKKVEKKISADFIEGPKPEDGKCDVSKLKDVPDGKEVYCAYDAKSDSCKCFLMDVEDSALFTY